MTQRQPTIIDVARRAGVSKSLVSMALRGDPGVSEARRAAVLDAAAQLGYRPNRAASILAGTRTDTVGVIVDDLRNPWYLPLLEGVREALVPHGLRLTLTDAAMNRHLGTDPVDDALSLRVDGLIMAAEALDPRGVPADLPLVVAGTRAQRPAGARVVAADEAAGARLALEHLRELEHRRIAHLTGTGGSARARREAAEAAAAEDPSMSLAVEGEGSPTEEAGYASALRLLRERPETTAILAANDVMAMGALAAARKLGLRVPEDLSVMGQDATPLAASPLLRLSTVDPHHDDVGRAAAEARVRMIRGEAGAASTSGPSSTSGALSGPASALNPPTTRST